MKPKIFLNENEMIVFEVQPKNNIIGYAFLTRFLWRYVLFPLFAIFIVFKNNDIVANFGIQNTFQSVLIVTLLLCVISFLLCTYLLKNQWYFITNQRCIIYSGFLGKNKKILPYNRIIDVDVNRDFLRTFFGISAIYLCQQGYVAVKRSVFGANNNGEHFGLIDGLDEKTAEQIANFVSQQMIKKN